MNEFLEKREKHEAKKDKFSWYQTEINSYKNDGLNFIISEKIKRNKKGISIVQEPDGKKSSYFIQFV